MVAEPDASRAAQNLPRSGFAVGQRVEVYSESLGGWELATITAVEGAGAAAQRGGLLCVEYRGRRKCVELGGERELWRQPRAAESPTSPSSVDSPSGLLRQRMEGPVPLPMAQQAPIDLRKLERRISEQLTSLLAVPSIHEAHSNGGSGDALTQLGNALAVLEEAAG